MRVFSYWPFTNSLLLISVLSVGLFAVLFYIPLFLQQARGLGAFDTGLLLLPQALVMAVLHADRRADLRQVRPALARGRSGWRSIALRHLPAHRLNLDTSPRHVVWAARAARGRAWAWP